MTLLFRLPTILLAAALAFSGCIAADDEAVPDDDPAPDVAPIMGPVTSSQAGAIDVSLATPVISFNNGGTFSFPVTPQSGNITGYVAELEWQATALVNTNLDLWFRDATLGAIPPADPTDLVANQPYTKITGPSPLRLIIDTAELPALNDYAFLVRAAGPVGVAQAQPFTLHITTFADMPLDAEYTVLES